jgi:hypothetical protein
MKKLRLLKNKKGLLPRNWIVLVVIIGMLITSSSYWIGAWEDKYNSIEPSNLSSSYNQISQVAIDTDTMESKFQPDKIPTGLGTLDFIMQGGYNVLLSVLSVPKILSGFIFDLTGEFGIPETYRNGIIILISVGAIFGVIAAIFRFRA